MMKVTLVAATQFFKPEHIPWETDTDGGEALAELSGRLCYLSWNKPNPATATNVGYLDNIMNQGHMTIVEHATVSFLIEGISRSCANELIRHRIASYSQVSQRFVDSSNTEFAIHPTIEQYWDLPLDADNNYEVTIGDAVEHINGTASDLYHDIAEALMREGLKRKQAREAARSVLPNDTETKIVSTLNLRAWRHFLQMRGSEHADREIRQLAVEIANQLTTLDGVRNVFQDVEIYKAVDGDVAVRVGKAENG